MHKLAAIFMLLLAMAWSPAATWIGLAEIRTESCVGGSVDAKGCGCGCRDSESAVCSCCGQMPDSAPPRDQSAPNRSTTQLIDWTFVQSVFELVVCRASSGAGLLPRPRLVGIQWMSTNERLAVFCIRQT